VRPDSSLLASPTLAQHQQQWRAERREERRRRLRVSVVVGMVALVATVAAHSVVEPRCRHCGESHIWLRVF
jgi:uncharacterized membrane protein YidH (DUF202 family)